jgi:hypothetical protein
MFMFNNATGQTLLLETRGCVPGISAARKIKVKATEMIVLPESSVGGVVYIASSYTRIGELRINTPDGGRAWPEDVQDSREYSVDFVPGTEARRAYYVAWHCPNTGGR